MGTLRTRSFSCTDKKHHRGKSKPKLSSSLPHEPSLFLLNEVSGQQFFSYLRLCSKAGIRLPTSSVTAKAASQHLLALGHHTAAALVSPTDSKDQRAGMGRPLTTSTADMFGCCLPAA